jgi:hypothetical protein
MSSRRPAATQPNETAERLRAELQSLKQQTFSAEIAGTAAETSSMNVEAHSHFDALSAPEQAAGSLGVHPEAWKPIK